MTDVLATDARRTKNSIIFYIALTAHSARFSMCWFIHRATAGPSPGFLILGLMWCPGVSGLLTRLAFQGNLRAWPRLGPDEISNRELLIPIAYSGLRVSSVLAGWLYDSNKPLAFAALTDRSRSARGTAGPDPFPTSRYGRRAGFVSFCARRDSAGADFSSPNLPRSLPIRRPR